MRKVYIFFKISNALQCLFPCFVRVVNPCCVNLKLFRLTPLTSAAKFLNNFRFTQHGFTTLTKHGNNQTNWRITLENLKNIWICLVFIWLYCQSKESVFIVYLGYMYFTTDWARICTPLKDQTSFYRYPNMGTSRTRWGTEST